MNDAYAAGLVDGEGTIYIDKNLSPRLEIQMADRARDVLLMLQHTYGGKVKMSRPATERWAESWRWTQFGEEAAATLRRVQPHMVLKHAQADLAIKVVELRREKVNCQEWPSELRARAEAMREQVMTLNRRGPAESVQREESEPFALRAGGDWISPQTSLFSDLGHETYSGRWPTSGMASPGGCWMLDMPESPNDAVESSLSDILEATVDPRYWLSARAAKGVLRRAAVRGRTIPPILARGLEAVSKRGTSSKTK